MAILDCRTCGESFNTKFKMKKLGGYINECNDCALRSGDMKIKYVGRPGRSSKDSSITIMRTDLESARTQLREAANAFKAGFSIFQEGGILSEAGVGSLSEFRAGREAEGEQRRIDGSTSQFQDPALGAPINIFLEIDGEQISNVVARRSSLSLFWRSRSLAFS